MTVEQKLQKYECKHCKNVQYIAVRLASIPHRMVCYVCGNPIPKQETVK